MRAAIITQKRAKVLRREMTMPERMLWALLRRKQRDGLRFRRQHPIGPYILDFYCPEFRLCVEVDGPAHAEAEQRVHDDRRDRWLIEKGINVVRFTTEELERRPAVVLATISRVAAPSTGFAGPPPPSLRDR